jgi:hypothetical protein
MKTSFFSIIAALCATTVLAGEQKLNIVEKAPKGGRFKVPSERVWPSEPGDGDICLWWGDRFAACSITIDDNCKPDHDWWLKITEELGIKVTWFVVTDGPEKKKNTGFNGTWKDYQRLADAGHSIQSHTTNHKSKPKNGPALSDAEVEIMYRDSLKVINENITNNYACCIAYPCGEAHEEIAAKYAIACRGVYGVPSQAGSINYMNTNKGGADKAYVEIVAFGATKENPKWIQGKKDLKRGLNTVLYHLVHHGRTKEQIAESVKRSEEQVRYIASFKDDLLWVCRYDDVMKYAQERDTAKLSCKLDGNKIRISVTDDMKDDVFNFPLTVKVRLPDGWKSVSGGTFIEHNGKPYALVDVVPDRGEVVLMASK